MNRSQHENKKTKVITAVTQVGSFCIHLIILYYTTLINAMWLSLCESQLKMKDQELDAKVENDNDLREHVLSFVMSRVVTRMKRLV